MGSLADIYRSYGGLKAFLSSPFMWLSLFATGACCLMIADDTEWASIPLRVLPALTGFTFASFSLFFAIIDKDSRRLLSLPGEDFDGQRPILVVVSKIVHSVLMQLTALVSAILITMKPFVVPLHPNTVASLNIGFETIAFFLFVYGIALVFSVAVTLYQLVEIVASSVDGDKQ